MSGDTCPLPLGQLIVLLCSTFFVDPAVLFDETLPSWYCIFVYFEYEANRQVEPVYPCVVEHDSIISS